mmetsp:Transcript_23103/g.26567  ORF Transcript_23103/g.26567 Transcript_23103/m.26567 type:complete len:118 (-) Transcript_23103:248-601(-)|eukprot:CAMPEP_0194379120 /NCGR_PEP_ID=MMETSP0174-20130528/38080_1 /TAXON_ID=216777 /ORGANISM="Proboscia alata, Strain PI-D3" /LENGTH=117 /DNA_ID=CAMNT_0039161601 /DNA_START=107 /DNA_END=460 /DNA_ORIENTATION=+
MTIIASRLYFIASHSAKPLKNSCFISTQIEPAKSKIQSILADYRRDNYAQTTSSRFKKELVGAVSKDGSGMTTLDEVERLFRNIGASHRISRQEIESVMCPVRPDSKIPLEQIFQLL